MELPKHGILMSGKLLADFSTSVSFGEVREGGVSLGNFQTPPSKIGIIGLRVGLCQNEFLIPVTILPQDSSNRGY